MYTPPPEPYKNYNQERDYIQLPDQNQSHYGSIACRFNNEMEPGKGC